MKPIVVFVVVAGGCLGVVLLVLGGIWLVWWGVRKAVRSRRPKSDEDMTDDELFASLNESLDEYAAADKKARGATNAKEQVEAVFSVLYKDQIFKLVRAYGEEAVEPLFEALKDKRALDTSETEGVYCRPFRMICALLEPYETLRMVEAIKPFASHKEPGLRKAAAEVLAGTGLAEAMPLVKHVLESLPDAGPEVISGLNKATHRKVSRAFEALAPLLWPACLEALVASGAPEKHPTFKILPTMRVMVWLDPSRALATFKSMGLTGKRSWNRFVLDAFGARPEGYPRLELEKLIGAGAGQDSQTYSQALSTYALIGERGVEEKLLRMLGDMNAAHSVRMALAERYVKGVTHEDPGPALSPEEHEHLMRVCLQTHYAVLICDLIACDGLEQYTSTMPKAQWEAGARGMELLGAEKYARACRDVIRLFGSVMDQDTGDAQGEGITFGRLERA